MKFTPNYTVSYCGEFHKAGIPFEIEDKDVKEMSAHGVVSGANAQNPETTPEPEEGTAVEETVTEQTEPEEEQPKRGRAKKDKEEHHDAD